MIEEDEANRLLERAGTAYRASHSEPAVIAFLALMNKMLERIETLEKEVKSIREISHV